MKGESGVVNDGLWQLVGALHVIKGFSSHWPVGKSGGYFRGKGGGVGVGGGGGGGGSAYKRGTPVRTMLVRNGYVTQNCECVPQHYETSACLLALLCVK